MTTPATGPLKFSDINTELGLGSTIQISMSAALTRTLAQVASGAIRFSDLRGRSNITNFSFNISAGNNINLRTAAIAAGWNQVHAVIANVLAGTIIGSASAGAYALTIDGVFANGVTLNNAGTIIGCGGAGGAGGNVGGTGALWNAGSPGGAGGPAILASISVSINNTGVIYGGGGGGGGSGGVRRTKASPGFAYIAGGGGGGGRGGSVGGLAGTVTNVAGTQNAGTAGTVSSAGTGGICTYFVRIGNTLPITGTTTNYASGGNGGDAGATGATPGALDSNQQAGGAGGGAGAYLAGNANVTWVATGTRAGGVS